MHCPCSVNTLDELNLHGMAIIRCPLLTISTAILLPVVVTENPVIRLFILTSLSCSSDTVDSVTGMVAHTQLRLLDEPNHI